MNPVLKLTVLAGLAVLVIGLPVASAGAADFKGTGSSVTMEAASVQVIETDVGTIECETLAGEGAIESEESSTLSVAIAEVDECSAFGLEASVEPNGCELVYNAGSWVGVGHSTGAVDVVCPPQQSIEISTGGLCEVTIGTQLNLEPVTYTNDFRGQEDVTVHFDVTKLTYSYWGLFCGPGANNNGIIEGTDTLTSDGPVTIIE